MFQHSANSFKLGARSALKLSYEGLRSCRPRLQLEELEQRQPLSVAPAGSEFRVNSYTTSNQAIPAVAFDAAGDYVVAWESFGQDGDGYGVYAQRYNAAGVAQGSEFQVNTYTTGDQKNPTVAMDSAGDFVVAWESYQSGSDGIYAQRYYAAGAAQGSEFQVNTYTLLFDDAPTVAMDSAGDFVVSWESYFQDGDGYGVYAQRYNGAGVAQGSEFQVNTYTTGDQRDPSVAMDSAGDFVVAWQSYAQDGSGLGVYAQRYDATGVAQGSEFQVNTYTVSYQGAPSVAMDSAGDFVVAWQSYGQDGSSWGVYAQGYNAAGVDQGSEFLVNTYTTAPQGIPSVAMDSAGDFVVAWESYLQDGSNFGIYAQCYNAARVAQGSEFHVNTYATNTQAVPSVAMDSAGDFVVAWESGPGNGNPIASGQDGNGYGVYAQRYALIPSSVAERFLFYSGASRYDLPGGSNGRTPLAFSNDNAIATDKSAYLPGPGAGSPATFANVSSYTLGINGIMVDLTAGGAHSSININDFVFKSGDSNSVDGTWTTLSGANLPTVSVRLGMTGAAQGAGTTSGTDRVELIWASGTAVTQKWLEVDVKAGADTGLQADDHFFFGSELGDNGASNIATVFKVGAADTTATQTHLVNLGTNQPITNVYDYNRDGSVGSFDVTQDQTHGTTNTTGLKNITIAAGGPFAPPPPGAATSAISVASMASGNARVASALVSSSQSPPPASMPPWIVNRLSQLDLNRTDLNNGPIAAYFEQLAHENSAKPRAILVEADQAADAVGLDDELLDSLVAKLGLD